MWRSLAWIGAAAATMAAIMMVLIASRSRTGDAFYAPTEALCRTGPITVDRSLDRPQVGRAVNIQKIAFDNRTPSRLIIDNSEICFVIASGRHRSLKCSYGGDSQESWRYGSVFWRNGNIFVDGREFRYCGPVTPPE